jgi:transposase
MKINNYPIFFKLRVLEYYYTKKPKINELLMMFNISNGSFYNWKNSHDKNTLKEKTKYTHKNNKITPNIKCFIRSLVIKENTVDRNKIINKVKRKFNKKISVPSVYKILAKMNITRKKVRKKIIIKDINRHKNDIITFKQNIRNKSRKKIISIDEVSIDTNIIQNYQWSKKGKRIEKIIKTSKKRYTMTCAISNKKIIYTTFIRDSSNALEYEKFLKNLITIIGNKYYLLMDNARIHHAKIIQEFVKQKKLKIIYNAPYSPEFNPIEKVFSKMKSIIQKYDNSNCTNLVNNVINSLNQITSNNLNNFFKKSLYFCRN